VKQLATMIRMIEQKSAKTQLKKVYKSSFIKISTIFSAAFPSP
jgi:hypothetical protein